MNATVGGAPGGDGLHGEGVSAAIAGRLIVDGVSIAVPPGAVTALIGPNGAGKSTLIRVLGGVSAPSAGSLRWADDAGDRDWNAIPRAERARIAALVEQDSGTELAIAVRDVVALGRTPHARLFASDTPRDREVVERSMATTGIARFADRDYATLSGGERQRVQLARALAQQPRLLLLDEPSNHLDVAAQLEVLSLVRGLATGGAGGEGIAVLCALHDLNLAAAYADTVVVLASSRVIAVGTPRETLTSELIAEVYGVTATVLEHPVTRAPLIAFSDSSARTTEQH